MADIRGAQAEATVERIEAAGGEALPVEVDITDEAGVDAMVNATVERFGRVDILINNAAVMFRFLDEPRTPFWEVPPEEFELVRRVNVTGSWQCAKAVLPYMKRQGRQDHQHVLQHSSGLNWCGQPRWRPTPPPRRGVIGLTRALAGEAGPYDITVTAVAPGVTNTETVGQQIAPDRMEAVAQSQALRRQAWPEDIVGTVLFLCSSDSDFMTGQVLCVDGGFITH